MSGHPRDEARERVHSILWGIHQWERDKIEAQARELRGLFDESIAREEAERAGRERAETRLVALDVMISEVEARRRKWTTPGILRGEGPFVIPFPLASSLEKLAALSAREPGKEPA